MLTEPKLIDRIKKSYDGYLNKGELLTESQIKKYLATFKKKYGPEVLQGLDGEELLTAMHDHSESFPL